MKWKRWIRDAGILVAFSGAFYVAMIFVNRLDGDTDDDSADFSYTRKQADMMLQRRDWYRAAVQFKKLTDKDPYDGRAWYMQALSHDELQKRARKELATATRASQPDLQAIENAQRRVEQEGQLAVEHYLIAREFSRYRKNALYQMAVIECGFGNFQDALDHLREFVDNGYATQGGMVNDPKLGVGPQRLTMAPVDEIPATARLHAKPRFWAIGRTEGAIRAQQQ